MFELLEKLTGSTDFMPHGDCLVWYPELLWLHVGSDIIIGLAYYCIAIVIFYFVFKRRDIPYLWMSLLFGAFIFLCGNTHLMAAWTVYVPSYWGEGYVKLVTAVVSIITAILLIPLMPRILSLPSLNQALEKISQLNTELEQRVDHLQREVIKREQAEQAWHESEKEFRQLVEASPVPTVVTVENEDVVYLNNKFTELFGYNLDEIPNVAKWWPLAYPDDEYRQEIKKQWYARLQQAAKTRTEIMPLEAKITCKDGSVRHILFRGSFIGEKLIVILNDITELRQAAEEKARLESQLRQAQKMEAIGVLAGGVAHDFNNLLTTIIGNTQFALADLEKEDPLYEELMDIKKAGEKAAGLTRQILTFSRNEIRKPEILDLNETVQEMVKMLRRMIRGDIELVVVSEPDLWKVHMDAPQMDQIIMNLAVNASDAMPEGGTLTIETANVELDKAYLREHAIDDEPGPCVMLAVTDTGVGMDESVRTRMFDPFFTTKDRNTGTGLGLATVYGIVRQNRGYIWSYSEAGQGTTIKVYLPRVDESPELGSSKMDQDAKLTGTETVLVLEDNDQVRNMALRILDRYGYQTPEAGNGEEAIRVSRDFNGVIHLLLTDVIMPGMSGKEAAEILKSERPDMKVLYMSGYTQNIIMQKGILASDINYIQKPFAIKVLARKVRETLLTEPGETAVRLHK